MCGETVRGSFNTTARRGERDMTNLISGSGGAGRAARAGMT